MWYALAKKSGQNKEMQDGEILDYPNIKVPKKHKETKERAYKEKIERYFCGNGYLYSVCQMYSKEE